MKNIIKPVTAIILLVASILVTACNDNKKQKQMSEKNNSSIFPKGEKLPIDYFTGNAYLTPLIAKDQNNEFAIGNVTFEPGARTHWHTHPKGQVLIVTEGEGFYQAKGKPAQSLKKGDVVNIPEDVEHWHGASVASGLVHIAITNYKADTNVIWLNAVSDAEYGEANKK